MHDTEIVKRFYAKVRITPGCWIWTASTRRFGYGQFQFHGRPQAAHRISYIINIGEIPSGMLVLHKCDVPGCVNPDHLFLGTDSDNMVDMSLKGRGRTKDQKGDSNGNARLDRAKVEAIFFDGRPSAEIADEYGISQFHVRRIKCGQAWTHLGLVKQNAA
ncbi:HNH endonuclease [Ralstonia phage UAM5]|nr:HNH endonuclease [Ralstonia phage UAM5]